MTVRVGDVVTSLISFSLNGISKLTKGKDYIIKAVKFDIITLGDDGKDIVFLSESEFTIKNPASQAAQSNVIITTGVGLTAGLGGWFKDAYGASPAVNKAITKPVTCECGAAKVYKAPTKSPLHSRWCPEA